MHPAALAGFRRNLALVHLTRQSRRVLDLGGQDVNGTVHEVVRGMLGGGVELDVLDIVDGPGVTIVGDARELDWWTGDRYDLVISTEMLEHVNRWQASVRTAAKVLRSGGWFVGTCASIGRRPHGATGAHDPAPGEHYGNVHPDDLLAALWEDFDHVQVQYERDPDQWTTCDLYWRARCAL